MSKIEVVQGEIFEDYRGRLSSMNSFDFEGVERFYVVHHPDREVVRGWHGHKTERKWFYCVKGSFTIALVEPDNWDAPSKELSAEIFQLSEDDSKIICVPAGYANCIKAGEDDSSLLIYSDKRIPEAYADSWRYDSSLWVDWSKY